VAYWEASTSKMNCREVSGGTKTGSEVTMWMRRSSASVHSGVQEKVESFFRRFVSGLAKFANPGINGHWNPSTPRVLCTSFTDFRMRGHSLIPAIFDRSIVTADAVSP
jgi:hypothetical protein